jgi:uncharacterized damage-inducible protein DinB
MITITRRNFLKYGAGASAALSLPWTVRQAFAQALFHNRSRSTHVGERFLDQLATTQSSSRQTVTT